MNKTKVIKTIDDEIKCVYYSLEGKLFNREKTKILSIFQVKEKNLT